MRAGRLDRRVIIEARTTGPQSATGAPTYTWATFAECWAEKRDTKARERFAPVTSQVVADVDTVWVTRWFPGGDVIQPDTHRIVHEGVVFNIVGIAEIGRRKGLEISTASRGERKV